MARSATSPESCSSFRPPATPREGSVSRTCGPTRTSSWRFGATVSPKDAWLGWKNLRPASSEKLRVTIVTPGILAGKINRDVLPQVTGVSLNRQDGRFFFSHFGQEVDHFELGDLSPGKYNLAVNGQPRPSDPPGGGFTYKIIQRQTVEITSGKTTTVDLGFDKRPERAEKPASACANSRETRSRETDRRSGQRTAAQPGRPRGRRVGPTDGRCPGQHALRLEPAARVQAPADQHADRRRGTFSDRVRLQVAEPAAVAGDPHRLGLRTRPQHRREIGLQKAHEGGPQRT